MMENISVLQKSGIIGDKKVRTNFNETILFPKKTITNPVIENLIAERGENFFLYLNWLGLTDDPNLMVLSSSHHYYYDYDDFKGVTTLINLKKLNRIKHLDSFLYTISHVLSPKTNFIGCFSDRKTQDEIGSPSRMYIKITNFLDSRTDIEINKKDISRRLESHGFEIIDMTDINGLTYFRTQNIGRSVE
jgi:hypothetical protein